MVKKKSKGGKKPKAPTRKRVASFSDEEVPVVTSLPPAVEGQLRCFLKVSVSKIHWTVPHYPDDVCVRLKWWGEDGKGILFRPLDEGAADPSKTSKKNTSARYPVCSGPRQFAAYLHDMGYLVFEVVHGPSLILLGKAELTNMEQLSANNPIHGFFPVMSVSSPSHQLADLYASIRFETISAAYNRLSSSAIPTVDTEWGQERGGTDVSDVHPTPPPSLTPATPIMHPSQKTDDLFVSPAPVKAVTFSDATPKRVEHTADPLILLPATDRVSVAGHREEPGKTVSTNLEGLLNASSLPSVNAKSGDLIGALLERGDRLRKAMAVFALEENEVIHANPGLHGNVHRHVPSGRLFQEILTSGDKTFPGQDPKESVGDNEPLLDAEGKAVDLVLGEEELVYFSETPHPSPEGSDVSETGDPLYDESLLRDLFYTTPIVVAESDSETTSSGEERDGDTLVIVSSDPETVEGNKKPTRRRHFSPKDITVKRKHKRTQASPMRTDLEHSTKRRENAVDAASQDEMADLEAEQASRKSPDESRSASSASSNFVESLGIETLTALGRINSARVVLENLTLSQSSAKDNKSSTYFVEYHFPVASHNAESRGRTDTVMEVTRVASKKVRDGVVLFTHRSAFPVFFDAAVTDQWWRLALTFRVFVRETGQRMPTLLGSATLPLRSVLQSSTLSCSAAVEVKQRTESGSHSSVTSPSSPSDRDAVGSLVTLQVKVELLSSDRREIHINKHHHKPPLPQPASSVRHTSSKTRDSSQHQSAPRAVSTNSAPQIIQVGAGKSDKPTYVSDSDGLRDYVHESITLFTLLWIPEGKGVTLQGSRGNDGSVPGIVARSNLYLVCRMFWCEDTSVSTVCWSTSEPRFGFKQVAPVQLTSTLLQRACNNFVVVEVWDKSVHHGDKLIGIVKLPLQQFYLSYRDPKITKTLMKSKYPVVAVDEWKVITNPFSSSQHGDLNVVLAMGSEEQISSLYSLKNGGDIEVGPHNRMQHHLDVKREVNEDRITQSHSNKTGNLVEHQFEVVVEDVRGLSVFGNTVWGETDCFLQYHFPHQRKSSDDDDEAIPSLKPHRTATTLCVPEPSFHDVARHTFVLRQGVPVQRLLLAAFTGSWVGSAGLPGSGSVPFELWRRYYYPNARDQLVAKANLPLAKLCAMVTMQKSNEPSVHSFSLPIMVLPGEEQTARQGKVLDTGLLDVTVTYRQSKLEESGPSRGEGRGMEDHVCILLELSRACGLKAAALCQARCFPSMSYPAEVGVSSYVVMNVPVGVKRMLVTRTVARTFCPDFSFHAELQVPITLTRKVRDAQHPQENVNLAERLETQEVLFEIWHQVARGTRDSRHVTTAGKRPIEHFDDQPDILLGTVRVPLLKLLTHRTGIKGWQAIRLPSEKTERETGADCDNLNDVHTVVGGLDLSLKFAEPESRDDVIHKARALGWSPPRGSETEDWDRADVDDRSCVASGVSLRFKVDKAFFPLSVAQRFGSGGKTERSLRAYARYKFYDKRPVCSRLAKVKVAAVEQGVCELKHTCNLVLPASPSLAWFLREERLEVQLWLGRKAYHDKDDWQLPRQRDRLVGSAYVDLSCLVLTHNKRLAQISGLFPLFKTGAEDLHGACIHVQIEATQPGASSNVLDGRQDEPIDVDASSDEYISSELRDESGETRSLVSSSDRTASQTRTDSSTKPTTVEKSDSTDQNTFPVHVIVERALHLPTVVGPHGERVQPDVYVSYQTTSSSHPQCTSVVRSCSSPMWDYQKLRRLAYPSDNQPMSLLFKVWHQPGVQQQAAAVDQQATVTEDSGLDAPNTDHVVGFASVDLAPLTAGMRQLNGWYNIVDFNGQCKGQLKVGIVPVTPLSPSRCLVRSSLEAEVSHNERFPQRVHSDTSRPTPIRNEESLSAEHCEHRYDTRTDREHLTDALSAQLEVHFEGLRRLRATGVTNQEQEPEKPASTDTITQNAWTSSCSSSLLFGQLRHNMKELDELQKDLQSKLSTLNHDTAHATSMSEVPSASEEPRGGSFEAALCPSGAAREAADTEPVITGDSYEAVSKMQSRDTDKPRGTSTTRNVASAEPVIGAQGDLETKLRSVEKPPFNVFEGGDPDAVLGDSAVATREDRFEGEDDISIRFASRVNEEKREEESHSDEHCTSNEDSDSLEEVSYINDNAMETYTQEKDSWISTDEEEIRNHPEMTYPGDDNKRTLHSAPDANEAINYITSLDPVRRGFSDSEPDCKELEQHGKYFLDKVKQPVDGSEENGNTDQDFEEQKTPCLTSISAVSELDNGAVLESNPSHGRDGQDTSRGTWPSVPTLPNFFMPTAQLEQSMRAVRLAASHGSAAPGMEDTRSKSKLLSRTGWGKKPVSGTSEMAEEYTKRKLLYNARERGDPPISSDEAQRIARIFSSKNLV